MDGKAWFSAGCNSDHTSCIVLQGLYLVPCMQAEVMATSVLYPRIRKGEKKKKAMKFFLESSASVKLYSLLYSKNPNL